LPGSFGPHGTPPPRGRGLRNLEAGRAVGGLMRQLRRVRRARAGRVRARRMWGRRMWAWALGLALGSACGVALAAGNATSVGYAQKNAALEFLQAVASGDPEQVALSIHPDDLRALRLRILNLLHDEAK